MSSVSGLSAKHRAEARATILKGCGLMLAHPDRIHYTQGPQRWEGIQLARLVSRGQVPAHSDCSSSATWLLWNALAVKFGVRDVVNATGWHSGYTGTIGQHGKRVVHDKNIKVGDLVLYGRRWPFEHVAVAVGGGYVFSHGSERGPFKLPIDYRSDRAQVRRFI